MRPPYYCKAKRECTLSDTSLQSSGIYDDCLSQRWHQTGAGAGSAGCVYTWEKSSSLLNITYIRHRITSNSQTLLSVLKLNNYQAPRQQECETVCIRCVCLTSVPAKCVETERTRVCWQTRAVEINWWMAYLSCSFFTGWPKLSFKLFPLPLAPNHSVLEGLSGAAGAGPFHYNGYKTSANISKHAVLLASTTWPPAKALLM